MARSTACIVANIACAGPERGPRVSATGADVDDPPGGHS